MTGREPKCFTQVLHIALIKIINFVLKTNNSNEPKKFRLQVFLLKKPFCLTITAHHTVVTVLGFQLKFTWGFSKQNEWRMTMQTIKKSKDHAPSFQSLFLLKNIQFFHSTEKNQLHLKCLLLTKSCKTPIERKSLFFECISEKLSNLLTFFGIVWMQVHVCTMQHSTEMEVASLRL